MFNVSERDINQCENLGRLTRSAVQMVLHDRIVIDTVTFLQRVFLLAVFHFHFTLHHVDELLTLVS